MTPGGHVDPRSLLERCAAFSDLPSETADELIRRMHEREWRAGDRIIRQGDDGGWMMLVADGRTRVEVKDSTGVFRTVAHLGEADLVGEMALITQQRRTADVIAETDVVAFVLPAADFEAMAAAHPELGMVLTHVVAERLGRADVDGLAGKTVDRYQILRCVGRGGMAIVYEGIDSADDSRVALKMMSHRLIYERGALARFQREADLLESIDHPNVARVFRRFPAFRTYFIAMEFCEGPTLASLLAESGRLPEGAARRAVGQLAAALLCLHGRGILHRDLKPANVLVTTGGVLKLTDFGLAKPTTGTRITAVTETRSVVGTPWYMPPEALEGRESGAPGDVYALGCILLELLEGRCPFAQSSFAELLEAKRRFRAPAAGSLGVSASTDAFLAAALAPEPSARTIDLAAISEWAAPLSV